MRCGFRACENGSFDLVLYASECFLGGVEVEGVVYFVADG